MNYKPVPAILPCPLLDTEVISVESTTMRQSIKTLDTETITRLTVTRCNMQRQQIRDFYRGEYGTDLIDDIKNELGGEVMHMLIGMLMKPLEYATYQLHKAIGRTGIDVKTVVEILGTLSNDEINEIKKNYRQSYNRDLIEHITVETTGNLRQLLKQIILCCRKEEEGVDAELAHQRAIELIAFLEAPPSKFESFFICLICKEHFHQLRAIISEFDQLNRSTSFEKLAETKFSGELKNAVKTVLECITNAPNFYARRIYKAIEGWVTDFSTITRIVVSRSEIDLENIKDAYARLFERSLPRDVKSSTSGDYKRALVAVIGKK